MTEITEIELIKKTIKMVLIIRNDLKMGKGKIVAQSCHAAINLIKSLEMGETSNKLLQDWEENLTTKIALKCNSEEELLNLYNIAKSNGLATVYVIDAGKTQVPVNTITVMAILGNSSKIDCLTGHLKLL
jgi:peptidyl-tRNA hydrolase, PTH2 family